MSITKKKIVKATYIEKLFKVLKLIRTTESAVDDLLMCDELAVTFIS